MSKDRGSIPLHDRHSIVLFPDSGRIGLHSFGETGWKIGIRISVDLRHYRKAGMTTGFMTLTNLDLIIPPGGGWYTGRIEDWELLSTQGYISYYKPLVSKLIPVTDDYVTFHLLDAFEEIDPYFYFGWGLRSDMIPPFGYRSRSTVAYMGVNYPIEEGLAPDFTTVPPQSQLLKMLKRSIIPGAWHLLASITEFTVDPDVTQQSHVLFRVREGRARYFRGILDYVSDNTRVVGKQNVDWSWDDWGNPTTPGDLEILSGAAKGLHFRVVGKQWTGSAPPPGYPPNTWLIIMHPDDPVPAYMGVAADDEFELTGVYEYQAFNLAEFYRVCSPANYLPFELDLPFTPVL